MRPIRLYLRAFGPYADEQVIDFRELGESTFFLIHGPTGSGKTSILDGITFALYGDTSTTDRQARQMRSDYAPLHVTTEVVFDFSLGNELYRIRRSPEQFCPKKRGDGFTKKAPEATLWSRTGLTDHTSEGKVLAGSYSETTAEVEKILGFRSDQFKQVVVLPQGQFREFLLAGSGKREEILEILFKTGDYRIIQEALKEKAKEVRNKWESVVNVKNSRLADSGAESLAMLEELNVNARERLPDLAAGLEKARKEVEKTREKVQEGEKILEKIDEKEEAKKLFTDLEARGAIYKEKEESLKKARKTLPLKEVEKEYAKRNEEKETAFKRYEELKTSLKAAEQEDGLAQQRAGEAEKKRPRLEELVKEMTRLEEYRKKAGSLADARHEFQEAEKLLEKAENQYKRTKELMNGCEGEREKKEKAFREKRDIKMSLDGLKESFKQCEQLYHDRLELDKHTSDYVEAEKIKEKVLKNYDQADRDAKKYKKELGELEKARQKGQAAIMAAFLKNGEPCPVCGSKKHPSPALSEEVLPTEKEVADMKHQLDECEQTRQEYDNDLGVKRQRATELKTKVEILEKRLKEMASEHTDILKDSLEKKKRELEEAEAAALSASSLEKEILLLKEKEKELRLQLENQEQAIKKAIENKGSAESRVAELEKTIPSDLRSDSALSSSLHALTQEKITLEKDLDQTKEQADKAAWEAAKYRGALKEAEEIFFTAKKEAETGKNKFEQFIMKAGFSSLEEYTGASIPENEMNMLEKEIQDFYANLRAAKERFTRALQQVKNLKPPDIDGLKESYIKASEHLENKIREEETLKSEIDLRAKCISDIKKMDLELNELESRYQVLGYISKVANGENKMRMTFQRFVQATLLDDVLIAASKRLSIMSRGRFLLRRVTEQADRRTAGGLNLEVDDGYTGKTRPVSTLSGGESFLAALSLALGLADVVQSYSGGMRLDTLFIDEGFGSLDTESLDLALRALIDLQKGGRLVAIISHVPELRERIDTRLEVIPGRSGSTARFVSV